MENKSAAEQYAEIQLRKHQTEQRNKIWATVIVFALVVIGVIGNLISSTDLNSNTAKKILEKAFNTTSNQYVYHADGAYMLIGLKADSKENALINLKKAYTEMSKKQVSDKLNRIGVVIYGPDDKVMFNSNIAIDEIIYTDWSKGTSYTEFMKLAKIQ